MGPHSAGGNAHTLIYRSIAELRKATIIDYDVRTVSLGPHEAHIVGRDSVATGTRRIHSLKNLDSSPGATFMPFSFALVLQFDAISARLRLCAACALGCTSGESDKLRLRRRAAAAEAGVAMLEPLEENDLRLRGV